MTSEAIHLAVWRDCEKCSGSGTVRPMDPIGIDVHTRQRIMRVACGACAGQGKVAIYIPIDELYKDAATPRVIVCIRQWMQRHDEAVDQLTAELDESGLVPDQDNPVPGSTTVPEGPFGPSPTQMDLVTAPSDLAVAARDALRELLDALSTMQVTLSVEGGKTRLARAWMAAQDVLESLDGHGVEAVGPQIGPTSGLHQATAASHPALKRGRVWCKRCGASRKVDAAQALSKGWPECCGETMTIDSPGERHA